MAYKYKKYTFPYSIEHEIKFKGKYGGKGEKRAPRVKATPEQIAKQNQRNREIRVRRMIKENFDLGDHWTTLKLPKGTRITAEELNGLFRKFCTNLRGRYNRRGEVLKWIARMEIGKQGGAHIHVLINRIRDSDKLITEVWRRLVEKIGFVIEKEGSEPLSGIAPAQHLTCHQAEMSALYKALCSIKEPAHLMIYTDSVYLASSIRWLPGWEANDWKNSKGKDIANREAWELLAQRLSGHETEFRIGEHHAFKKWLETEVNRK